MLGPDGDQLKVNFYETVVDNSQKSSFIAEQRFHDWVNITIEIEVCACERFIIEEDTQELPKNRMT